MVEVKEANISDVRQISEFAKHCFTDTFGHLYSEDNLNSHLEETCSEKYFKNSIIFDKILLAKIDSNIVGYIKFGEVGIPLNKVKEDSKEIHRLYIHPNFKQIGIGTQLMNFALSEETLKNSKNIYLSVYENNEPAKIFYKNYGFEKIGEYNYYVGSHVDLEHIMHKENL